MLRPVFNQSCPEPVKPVYSVFVVCRVRDNQQHPVVARLRSLDSAIRLLNEIREAGAKAFVSTGKNDPVFFLKNDEQLYVGSDYGNPVVLVDGGW